MHLGRSSGRLLFWGFFFELCHDAVFFFLMFSREEWQFRCQDERIGGEQYVKLLYHACWMFVVGTNIVFVAAVIERKCQMDTTRVT